MFQHANPVEVPFKAQWIWKKDNRAQNLDSNEGSNKRISFFFMNVFLGRSLFLPQLPVLGKINQDMRSIPQNPCQKRQQ